MKEDILLTMQGRAMGLVCTSKQAYFLRNIYVLFISNLMNTHRLFFILLSSLFLGCLATIIVVLLPGILYSFDLSTEKTARIGDTIGGITAPFIGVITSVLLYITFREQQRFNNAQGLKNEVDLYISMFKMLSEEVDQMHYEEYEENGEVTKTFFGIDAFNQFNSRLRQILDHVDSEGTLITYSFASQLLLIINSYRGIASMLRNNNLNEDFDAWFNVKLLNFYAAKLNYPFSQLVEAITAHPSLSDSLSSVVVDFHNENS